MSRWLVVGAKGMLGTDLLAELAPSELDGPLTLHATNSHPATRQPMTPGSASLVALTR